MDQSGWLPTLSAQSAGTPQAPEAWSGYLPSSHKQNAAMMLLLASLVAEPASSQSSGAELRSQDVTSIHRAASVHHRGERGGLLEVWATDQ